MKKRKKEKEFKSQLEEIIPATELNFPPTPAFGAYKEYLEHAVAHPAKMNTKLLEFLIENFTKPGDIVLDPMAGSGSTCVVSALYGRNAIGVELEEKFYKWMEEAKKKVEETVMLTPKGKIVNICGDARHLSELLSVQSDVAITSPPYAETYLGGGDIEKRKERLIKAGYDPKDFLGGKARNTVLKHYDEVDTVITSPPYSECQGSVYEGLGERVEQLYKEGKITKKQYEHFKGRKAFFEQAAVPYGESKGQIAGLSHGDMDALIKSLVKNDKPTYLSEMLKVYREMFKVLKSNGSAIIVVKPFIRNKKIVDLPYHTWLLMEKAGFKLEKLFKLRLKQLSFWRILYWKKYPQIPRISHEYILICRKEMMNSGT